MQVTRGRDAVGDGFRDHPCSIRHPDFRRYNGGGASALPDIHENPYFKKFMLRSIYDHFKKILSESDFDVAIGTLLAQ